MRTGSKREGPGRYEVLGSRVLVFFGGFFLLVLVVGSEVAGDVDVIDEGEGDPGEGTVEGIIDRSAGLTVEGSNEGSVATWFAIHVL